MEQLKLTAENLPGYIALRNQELRSSFKSFRLFLRPHMEWNWWMEFVANELEWFAEDLIKGKRPKIAIEAPPQHGKSWVVEDFACWLMACHPELKTVFASYSQELGEMRNLNLQRHWKSEWFKEAFPEIQVGRADSICNLSYIEMPGFGGSFRNTTVESAINGMELNLGLIDDPHKGRAEAMSKVTRNKVWNWFTDDWMARMNKNNGQLIVQTRWHPDDLIGRYKSVEPALKIIHFPAIAEKDEYFDLDNEATCTRRRGEALFPEIKPLEHLLERKKLMTQASWESEYQQNPIIVGGGIFPIDKLRVVPVFDRTKVRKSIRYVDKAGTKDGGAHTAMVLMSALIDGRFLIEDVVRGQWSALEREETLLRVAQSDRDSRKTPYEVVIEQEPGSGGKESAEATIRMLRGFRVFADKPGADRSKEIRAEPLAAQVQGSNVWLVAGTWVQDFLEEAESWPNGRYKDQIDAAAGAFNRLTSKPMYNLSAFD